MHLIFFIEEPSAEAALANLLPKMIPAEISFQFIVFQGKTDLRQNLASRLKAYASWLPGDYRIIVLIDEDRQNCHQLKNWLDEAAQSAGLLTKSQAGAQNFQVLNRIAVEELEAWFFGDIQAVRKVYPKLSVNLGKRKRFLDPDAITGGTWEALESVLKTSGYHPAGYPKIQAAKEISAWMEPTRNRSHSFQVFYTGLLALFS